ncbi:MAG TPA: hypothetical protein VK611_03525 [Acidimicrobiales bacterium]|nr:hypothetical protein [Acidimicrobiales bacterium]
MTSSGPLLAADESLTHQIATTFARVAPTDRAWTEKVWAMAAARDGSLSLAFGLGKYTNRNVMDAFAGVSRGTEQWTVRGSRRLAPEPERTGVGPIRYEVVEPLSRVRIALDANDVAPISFECELRGVVPPAVEEQETHVSRSRYRIDADVVRFHQTAVAEGWVEVDGERHEIDPGSWVGARDRSWGVRYGVGRPEDDVEPTGTPADAAGLVVWMPVTMTAADGTPYGLFVYHQRFVGRGWSTGSVQGGIERPAGAGRPQPFRDVVPDLRFDDGNRRLLGGTLRCVLADGGERTFTVRPVSDTGFHLGTGLYGGFEDHWHGEWRGKLHVEGEHVVGCDRVDVAHRLHQHRDCIVRVEDPATGDTGVGTVQSIVTGAHPDLGLTAEASFL